MNRLILTTLLITLCSLCCFSQEMGNNPVDTSYTLFSAYNKLIKKFPFIQPVKAEIPSSVTVKKNLVYANYDGREMHIDVYMPADITKPAPAVILIHGGGWRSGNKNMETPLAVYLAQKGFVAAAVEYSFSTEALYPAAVVDSKTAIRWLRKNARELHVNPDKIAIAGNSSGGQLAALIASTNESDRFIDSTRYAEFSSDVQAVIDIDGILAFIHPESGEGVDQPGKISAATQWFGYSKEEKPELWNDASALTHAGKTFPPVLFINSSIPRFHAGRDDLIFRLNSLGIYSETHEIPNSPHTFWLFDPWFDQTARWTANFLINHLSKP